MCFVRGFLIFFGIFQLYYRVLFRFFGPIISVILIFFLGKRGNMLFLARIAPDYHLFFDFSGR